MEAKGQRCGTFLLLYPVRDAKTTSQTLGDSPAVRTEEESSRTIPGETTVK
jgi:hypothetical protein